MGLQMPLWLLGLAWSLCCWEAGLSAEGLQESCCGMKTEVCPGAHPGAWSSACLNLMVFLPAASGSRNQSPAVVVTVVTISALLVLGSVMSVLAIWRRYVAGPSPAGPWWVVSLCMLTCARRHLFLYLQLRTCRFACASTLLYRHRHS